MGFFFSDIKKIFLLLIFLLILFIGLFFFTFLVIIILPMIIIIFFIKKHLYSNSAPRFKRNNYDDVKNGNSTFIDVDYKKEDEKEL
tara:strand:+ start:86 stop:343 length:258 start_codon:yes stop_codon:yes gene_type:complete